MEKDSRFSALHKLALKYISPGISQTPGLPEPAEDIGTVAIVIGGLIEKLEESLANEQNLRNEMEQARLATKHLEETRLLFTSIVNLSDDAIVSKDLNGIITSWNAGAEKIFGYTSGEVIGKHISILIPPILQIEEGEIMEQIKEGQNIDHYETERLTKEGSIIHVSLTISPIKDASGHIIGASKICRDITRQKNTETELRRTGRLYAFLSAINQSIVHIADEHTLLFNACTIAREVGNFQSARIGLLDEAGRLNMITETDQPDKPEGLLRYSGTDFSSHLLRETPTGRVLATGRFAVSNDALNDPGLSSWKTEMELNGVRSCASFPLLKLGKTVGVFSFLSHQKDFFDQQEINLLKESANDISFALDVIEKDKMRKQVEAEIKILNETLEAKIAERTTQLEFANKELESFSYSVAHDLRSPLRGINGFASIITEDYGQILDAEGKRLLGEIKMNANKMGNLIDELLTLSKIGRKELKKIPVNMAALFADTLTDITRAQKHYAKIICTNIQPVLADEGLMRHVIFNLVANAVKYSSKNPEPVIEINSKIEGNHIIYSIADNGVGFDMRHVDKLFGVFQRLHGEDEFEGTGVGLAIAHRIVNKHGGKIWAESTEGKGATFYFSLPNGGTN